MSAMKWPKLSRCSIVPIFSAAGEGDASDSARCRGEPAPISKPSSCCARLRIHSFGISIFITHRFSWFNAINNILLSRSTKSSGLRFCHFKVHQTVVFGVGTDFCHPTYISVEPIGLRQRMQANASMKRLGFAHFDGRANKRMSHAPKNGFGHKLRTIPRCGRDELDVCEMLSELDLHASEFCQAHKH